MDLQLTNKAQEAFAQAATTATGKHHPNIEPAQLLLAFIASASTLIIELIEGLRSRSDVSMIVIAHNYVHVLEMCDRVNLLRNGRIVLDKRTDETTAEELTRIVAAEYRVGSTA